MGQKTNKKSLAITLECWQCGWSGKQGVRMVIFAAGRLKRDTFGVDGLISDEVITLQHRVADNFSWLVIPHPVECPGCGAVGTYRPMARTGLDILFSKWKAPNHDQWQIQRVKLDSKIGLVHPLVAAIHYAYLMEKDPDDYRTGLRLANSFRTGGFWPDAEKAYNTLLAGSTVPAWIKLESLYNLALMAGYQGEVVMMGDLARRGLELCRSLRSGTKTRKNRKPLKEVGLGVSLDVVAENFVHLLTLSSEPERIDPMDLLGLIAGSREG